MAAPILVEQLETLERQKAAAKKTLSKDRK
jgi:hypothetical protein